MKDEILQEKNLGWYLGKQKRIFSFFNGVPMSGWLLYLRRGVRAALWRMADRRVGVLHAVFDAGSSLHFDIGDGEDALAVGAWDFALIPVLVDPTNQRDPLPLEAI